MLHDGATFALVSESENSVRTSTETLRSSVITVLAVILMSLRFSTVENADKTVLSVELARSTRKACRSSRPATNDG
ncbi:unnamed protein product [Heligmosomoides polygyrus]|uniref:Uncharacterized protein n=1 Tax=Heligmosomoides polygyrus TaxID=6339 RepID=A0A3P7YIV9_HELPZ|nr:unnamed protein product [Heligmosomoides polygyrus]